MSDQTRNLNPTPEARVAMIVWGHEYAHDFGGGSMDFWDQLSETRKRKCRLIVKAVTEARAEIEALRGALQKVIELDEEATNSDYASDNLSDCADLARQALKGQTQ